MPLIYYIMYIPSSTGISPHLPLPLLVVWETSPGPLGISLKGSLVAPSLVTYRADPRPLLAAPRAFCTITTLIRGSFQDGEPSSKPL